MNGRGFDDLARGLATRGTRRAVIKGLLGLGGAAMAVTANGNRAGAAWSTVVCLPTGPDAYTPRLVPTAAVPFYQIRYGAVTVGSSTDTCPAPLGLDTACACACVAPRVVFPGDGTCALPCTGDSGCAACGGTCAAALGEDVSVCYTGGSGSGTCERSDQCELQDACNEGTCRPVC